MTLVDMKKRSTQYHDISSTSQTAKPKRHISPEGLARIRAATRARWAKVRAGKK